MKAKIIFALARTAEEQTYFEELANAFSYLFELTISPNLDNPKHFEGFFAFEPLEHSPQLLFSWQKGDDCLQAQLPLLPSPQATLELAQFLTDFYVKLDHQLLDNLPYKTTLYDKNGHVIYDNQQPTGPLLASGNNNPLEPWLMEALQQSPSNEQHLLLPQAFDAIMMSSYRQIENENREKLGYIELTQDLKSLLSSYLSETGQALVGWSDVTSGASIASDDFEF